MSAFGEKVSFPMTEALTITIAQVPSIVGDINGNLKRARAARAKAAAAGSDLIVFSELFICGYPPEDLVQKGAFHRAARQAIEEFADDTSDGGPAVIVGAPWKDGDALYNAGVFLRGGQVEAANYKHHLPNYGVFDEPRRFTPGDGRSPLIDIKGIKLGLMICEDMWLAGPGEHLCAVGADILIAPHGSPFRETALEEREAAARARATNCNRPLMFINQLAGQDEIVFEGAGFVMNADGDITHRCPQFEEDLFHTKWERRDGDVKCVDGPHADWVHGHEMIYRAVTMAVRDYVKKNHFKGVVIGLSGGVDSALTAAIAVDALGAANVSCVMMPSRYTSEDSLEDADACAKALGVSYSSISIAPGVSAFNEMLGETFAGLEADTTEENIQSRLRGVILMALSNKFGQMVLTTGNKSEMSVGYATLYGDMNGGYNPLKDIYKMDVFALCRWRNAHHAQDLLGPTGVVIPERIITKPPSAELRDDQKDEDSLPPYEILDGILERLIERELSVSKIVADGYERKTVERIEHLLYIAEYKRRQAPPGPKVTKVNFGRDRRYPITNAWRDR